MPRRNPRVQAIVDAPEPGEEFTRQLYDALDRTIKKAKRTAEGRQLAELPAPDYGEGQD